MATFFNLTNHPSAKWSDEQKASALHMVGGENGDGEIVDIPFPNYHAQSVDLLLLSYLSE